jgi:hypothetical protein
MKLEIYNQIKQKEEMPVRLALKQKGDNILVCAVDKNGDIVPGGCLISFQPSGKVIQHCLVSPYLGFDLDDDGQIKID